MIMNVPDIEETRDHWKVGDGMKLLNRNFVIGQIVVVLKKQTRTTAVYDINFYDADGKPAGGLKDCVKKL